MDGVGGITGWAATPPSTQKATDSRDRIADAARQFESLLIAQLLRSMHGEDGGWLGTGDDQAGEQALELAEGQLAQAISEHGGLGLARTVAAGLHDSSRPTTPKPAVQKLQR